MKLTRIVLEDFKRFTGRVVVDSLAPGLNVFTGDNEAGKSTLADAVRKVFLERHKSSAMDGLAPWSKPTAKPQVEVSYAIDGVAHRLTKSFGGSKGTCELHIGERRFDGDEAEEALAALLGFERPQKGASRPEHGGIPGLLWVQQGASQDVQASAQHAASHLREALGELAGGTIAQGDDVLIQTVRVEMGQLVTDKQRKPFGPYAEAETQLAEARTQLAALEEQERAFNQDLERLATLQTDVDSQAASKPWDALEARAVVAAEAARSLATARTTTAQTTRELLEAQRTATLLNSQEQSAVENEQAVQQLTQQLAELQRKLDETRSDESTAHAEVVALQTQNTAATKHRTKAEAAENYAELVAKLDAAISVEDQTRAAFKTATDTAEAIRELTVVGTFLKLNPDDLLRLRVVESDLVLSQAQVTAALTKLEYRLEPGVAAMLGGAPLVDHGVTSLDVPTTLAIPGVGELTISPGVTDLPQLRAKVASLEDERTRLLQAMGVATLKEAEEKQTQCNESAAELKTKQVLLKSQAPTGVDALKTALVAAEATVKGLRKQLPEVPPPRVEGTLADAKAAVELVLSKFDAARDHESKTVAARATTEGQHKQVAESLTAKQTQLQSAEYLDKRKQTRVDLVNANAAAATLRDKETEAQQALDALLATADEGAEERLKRSAAHARDAYQEKHTKLVQLRTRLEDVGATGLGEQLGQTSSCNAGMMNWRGEPAR